MNRMLTGILELDGVAVAGGRVLLISGDMTRLLESTTTDDSGVFRFALTDVTSVVVLAKIQGQVLSIAYRIIDLAIHGPGPYRIGIDSSTELFHSVKARIVADEGRPPYLLVHLDPVRLIGIPEPLEKFFRTIDENVVAASFSQVRVEGDGFEIRVQNGSYRVDAGYFDKSHLADIANYALAEVTPDGEETTVFEDPFASFMLDVERDRDVELTIRPLASEK